MYPGTWLKTFLVSLVIFLIFLVFVKESIRYDKIKKIYESDILI